MDAALQLRDCQALFVMDDKSRITVDLAGLSGKSFLRVEGVTAYNDATRTYYIRVSLLESARNPEERVMEALKAEVMGPGDLIELGKWAREQADEYDNDVLRQLADTAIIKAIRAKADALKRDDWEGYFSLAQLAGGLLARPSHRESYIRQGIEAYIRSGDPKDPRVYYRAADKAQELLPGSALPDVLVEKGFVIEYGGAAPKTAEDFVALADRAREMFDAGPLHQRLLGKALDVEYAAIRPGDYTALYALARKAREVYPDYPNLRTIVTTGVSAEKAAMDPQDPEAWVRLGNRILYFFNDKHQAGLAFRTAAGLAPENEEIRAKLLELGYFYYRGSWWWKEDYAMSDLFRKAQELEDLVTRREVAEGMTPDQVLRAKGRPAEVCGSAGAWGASVQWVYDDGAGGRLFITFVEDLLVSKGIVTP